MRRDDGGSGRDRLFLALVVAAGLALRLDFLIQSDFVIDADEGIVGLMAKHIAEGGPWPVFYYGQHYMGSLEALCCALLFRLFGPSDIALKAVPLLFSLALIVLVYHLALRIGNRFVARAAALLTALPPASLTIWSAKARGGFIEVIVIGACAFVLACGWLRRPALRQTAAIGFLLGVGWWVNNQILYFMLPIGVVMSGALLTQPGKSLAGGGLKLGQHALAGLAAFLAGSFPFWLYNVQHSFASFGLYQAGGRREIFSHAGGLFTTALPMILGSRLFWHEQDVFPGATSATYALYAVVLGIVVWNRRRQLLQLPLLRIDACRPVELLLLFLLVTPVIFTVSTFGSLVQAPRYLLPLYAALFVVVALGIHMLYQRSRAAGIALLGVFVALNLASNYWGGRSIPGEPFVFGSERVARDQQELVDWLKARHYSFVRTNYWIGYRLAFETSEQIKFAMFQAPYQVRMPEYEKEAAALPDEQIPLVLVPKQAAIVEKALRAIGISYERATASGYVLLYNLTPRQQRLSELPKELFDVSANFNEREAIRAADGDVATRWGSAHPQAPEMRFELTLKEPESLRGLRCDLGQWRHDYPRGLTIEAVDADGRSLLLVGPEEYSAVRYYLPDTGVYPIYFAAPVKAKRIILTQTGSDPVFDWSIAEIALYR